MVTRPQFDLSVFYVLFFVDPIRVVSGGSVDSSVASGRALRLNCFKARKRIFSIVWLSWYAIFFMIVLENSSCVVNTTRSLYFRRVEISVRSELIIRGFRAYIMPLERFFP